MNDLVMTLEIGNIPRLTTEMHCCQKVLVALQVGVEHGVIKY